MRVLKVEQIEPVGKIAVLYGTVENERIVVGQDVVLVSRGGLRDPAVITGILPNYEGDKEFDEGSVGRAVKVLFKRRAESFAVQEIASLEKADPGSAAQD